jgi:enoyl-CoA hydratase/carnithine racemase
MIRSEVEGEIATLVIDRPAKRNALTYALLGDFLAAVKRVGEDPAVRVVIVTGAGGAFCAGTDLADLASVPAPERGRRGSAEENVRRPHPETHDPVVSRSVPGWWPLVACPKPVIAAVDGVAVGMGAEFTSQCDIRIASTRARFAWNFAQRGLVPDTGAGSWLLPRIVGHARALELLYSGRFVEAEEALALGYVARVVSPEQCLPAARELAQSFLAGSPFSQQRMKALVYRGLARDQAEHMQAHTQALTECFGSADHKEGVAAFLEKRPARFTGR